MDADKNYLAPIINKSMVDIVISRITDAIIAGDLKPGDKIPTEPELVNNFGVGRNTVREAIRILVAYGVLEIRRPEGTFVCDGFSQKLLQPLVYSIILQKQHSYDNLIGLRKVIENGIMQLLLKQGISETHWELLNEKCDILVEALKHSPENIDINKVADADIELHRALASATNNVAVTTVHETIVKLTVGSRLKTIEDVIRKGDKQYLIDTHINLLEKLKGDSMEELYKAINDSYFYWKDIYRD